MSAKCLTRHIANYSGVLLVCLMVQLRLPLYGQEYSYIQYGTKDGLPGSTVHGISQDNDGFLWFATEAGLSRFDGKAFRNFTIADGLPSNEVFFTYCDSRNRIWIASFKNALCYYYKGKIYNHDNDPQLGRIREIGYIKGIAEMNDGRILLHASNGIYLLPRSPDTAPVFFAADPLQQTYYPFLNLKPGEGELPPVTRHAAMGTHAEIANRLADPFRTGTPAVYYAVGTRDTIWITTADKRIHHAIPIRDAIVRRFYNDSIFILGDSQQGVRFYDFKNRKYTRTYLPERRVQAVFEDKDKNLWFSTKGSGVFRLNRQPFVAYTFGSRERPFSVYQIYAEHNRICAVTEKGTYWSFARLDKSRANEPLAFSRPLRDNAGLHRLQARAGKLLHFFDVQLPYVVAPLKVPLPAPTVKTAFYFHDSLLIAAANGVFLYTVKHWKLVDTLLYSRSTCALKARDTIYIGSLEGLYIHSGGQLHYMGDQLPQLRSRISTIKAGSDDVTWIGTYESGVIGLRHGKIVKVLDEKSCGLSNNVCRSLFLDGRYLWVGTEYGVNKVDVGGARPTVVKKYDMTDGLQSNNINAIYTEGSIVYIGSPEGITCFDEDKTPVHGSCKVLFTDILVANRQVDIDTGLIRPIEHHSNSIRFEYAGLSFVSAGTVTYRYRLLGLSDRWRTTGQMYIDYPSLPSGKYTFQIRAINKLGDESALLEKSFTIAPLLWERKGIQLLIGGVLMGITGLFFQLKFRALRKKNKEQQELQKRMATLEQKALRAQMNPHFIFNCLNSIQHFIVTHDAKGANFYLVRFAGLVRSTLEHASDMYILLSSELEYLSAYLDLEQMQAAPAFRYSITVEPGIDAGSVMIPNMLVQPFVENAIKHGVSRMAGEGIITVTFSRHTDAHTMCCVITDNGPGIPATGGSNHKAHHSRGIAISRERIEILNQVLETGSITLDIQSGFADATHAYGTKILLTIPLLYRQQTGIKQQAP